MRSLALDGFRAPEESPDSAGQRWPLTAAPSNRGKVPQKGDGLSAAPKGVGEKMRYLISRSGDGFARQTPPGARPIGGLRGPRPLGCVARVGRQRPTQRNDRTPHLLGEVTESGL